MKKNIFTIIIMAISTVNLILIAVLLFTTVPTLNRTNNLVTQISQMVDLELEASEENGNANISVKDTEVHTFKSSSEGTITINLKASEDGSAHYALLDAAYVTINKNSEDYADLAAIIDQRGSDVLQIVTDIIAGYDYQAITTNRDQMKNDVVAKLQNFFDTDAIVDVSFDNLRIQ